VRFSKLVCGFDDYRWGFSQSFKLAAANQACFVRLHFASTPRGPWRGLEERATVACDARQRGTRFIDPLKRTDSLPEDCHYRREMLVETIHIRDVDAVRNACFHLE